MMISRISHINSKNALRRVFCGSGVEIAAARVEQWFSEHPGGSVSACARELDITRKTAGKWMPEHIRQNRL